MLQRSSRQHLYFIDLLRVYLTVLVFYHHSAIAFGASGGWYYKAKELISSNVEGLMSINMAIDQSYFMSLFFFISAYLMPASFDRKGAALFLEDRMKRLVIPLVIFFFIINPLLVYWIYDAWYEVGVGPMWFVFTLIVFELAYVLYRVLTNGINVQWKFPKLLPTIIFMLLMGLWAFFVRVAVPTGINLAGLQLGYFPLYIAMYFLGIIAYRSKWFDVIKLKNGYRWILAAFFLVTPLFFLVLKDCTDSNLINGGLNRFAASYAFWEPVMCVAMSYFLLAFSKKYFNKKNKFIDWLAKDSYSFYIIHPVVLVGCTFLAEMIPVVPFMRFIIVLCIGIPLCFISGYIFKRFMAFFKINI